MFLEFNDEIKKQNNIFDDVEIIVDPELKDDSTVEINEYINKHILQCRICGNMFPSTEILDNEAECPICGSISPNGFIYKGTLKHKNIDSENDKNKVSDKKVTAINKLNVNNKDIKDTNIDTKDDYIDIDIKD